jgi:ABC-2 type transport system ATP-binding protein
VIDNENGSCISVCELKREYNKKVHAINGISFNINYGKVFGFLGPNGAGKTTTIKVLTTLISPSSGKVCIFGKDVVKHQSEIRRRIGVVSQQPSFEAHLTVERALDLYGLIWGLEGKRRKDKVREIIDAFDLNSIRNTKNDELSIGQRRRVQVAREFMHDMDLLFLDEPTVGLDPSARRLLLDYIKNQVKYGLTVFFTTHIMEEAEYLCDEIAVIDKGKIIAIDTPTGLKLKYGDSKTIELGFREVIDKSTIHLLSTTINQSSINVTGTRTLTIRADNAQEIIIGIIQLLSKNNIQLDSIAINPPSLEEVFLTILNDKRG